MALRNTVTTEFDLKLAANTTRAVYSLLTKHLELLQYQMLAE